MSQDEYFSSLCIKDGLLHVIKTKTLTYSSTVVYSSSLEKQQKKIFDIIDSIITFAYGMKETCAYLTLLNKNENDFIIETLEGNCFKIEEVFSNQDIIVIKVFGWRVF